jgi:hypothetical protein
MAVNPSSSSGSTPKDTQIKTSGGTRKTSPTSASAKKAPVQRGKKAPIKPEKKLTARERLAQLKAQNKKKPTQQKATPPKPTSKPAPPAPQAKPNPYGQASPYSNYPAQGPSYGPPKPGYPPLAGRYGSPY